MSRVGVNITSDDINNFFTLQPNRPKNQNKAKNSQSKGRDSLTRQHNSSSTKTAEERRTSGSRDVYHILGDSSESGMGDYPLDDENVFTEPPIEYVGEQVDINHSNHEWNQPGHPALDVYNNYSFEHKYDSTLPITEHRESIIGTIEMNQVTIIQGATGSGKTTQVPQYILDYYQEKQKYCNILVTQPRRIAAQSIAKRVCDERRWPLGNLVGFQVARDRKVSEDTRITYMTTGVLLQKLIKNKDMNEYTHVILDEIHERDQDIDLAMLIVKKFLRTVSRHTKVILMSATMDCSLFSKYFAIQVRGKLEGAPVVCVEGKMYDVAEYYLDHLKGLGELPQQIFSEPEISDKCYKLAKALIMKFDEGEALVQGAQNWENFQFDRGTVLVFLPGFPEIDAMHKVLENIEHKRNLHVLILHSQITSVDQSKIFMKAKPGKRKVILATNIAESSITVPDIKYVIDFCLVKNLETDRETNYQSLRIAWAPKSSLNQRKGRAGRVSNGECFRMVRQEFCQRLQEYGVPEMQRCPLSQVVLQVKLLDIGDPCTVLKMALQPPNIHDIRKTILHLKEVGALTLKQRGRINPLDGDLTFVGKVLGSLPVDVRIGKMIILGYVFGCLEYCLIIGAALSLKSCFARPFKKEFEAYSHKMEWARMSFSDCIAALSAYKEWKGKKSNFGFGKQGEVGWVRQYFVETKMLLEIDQLALELENRLKPFGIQPNRRMPAYLQHELSQNELLILKVVICGAFYPFYFTSGEIDDAEATKALSGHDPFSTVVVHNVPSPGYMYKSSIAALFRPCGKGKFLHFESSRCYVEFDKIPNQKNLVHMPVLPAVYLAIKMRQLRMNLVLHVCERRDEELRKRFESLQMSSSSTSNLRTDRISASLDVDSDLTRTSKGKAKQVDLKATGYFQVNVTAVIDAGHFWAHYGIHETFANLEKLQSDINAMGGKNLSVIPYGVRLSGGEVVLGLFEEEFYRAKVISTFMDEERKEVIEVFFVDYGNTSCLRREQLRRCPPQFLDYPFQAFECYLCGIRPIHGEWVFEANRRFHHIAQDRVLLVKVFSVVGDTMRVDLYAPNEVHINELLVREGFAQRCEEPHISKIARQDSEQRERVRLENKAIMKELDDAAESYDVEDFEGRTIKLRGPMSPYELSFYSMTYNGKFRATNVDRDSVNSVFLCEEPQDKHPRFMVSANVGINASGTTLIARDTTVMPNIHGIASLIPLLFAPFAEYRMDMKRTRYIGALCGLGYVEETGAAIMPEHDMEVTFDVEFNKTDVVMINNVRQCINLVLKSEEGAWGSSAIEKIQLSARRKTLELLYCNREDMEPTTYRRPYTWNQIPEIVRLNPQEETDGIPPLYTLHCAILLDDVIDAQEDAIRRKEDEVRQLYNMAGRSTELFANEVVCPLCTVKCRHPHALNLHLETKYHQKEEQLLFNRKAR